MATVIDTHEAVKELTAADLTEAQAEAITRLWRRGRDADLAQVATKAELDAGLERLRLELGAKLSETKFDILKWVVPILAAQFLAVIGLYLR